MKFVTRLFTIPLVFLCFYFVFLFRQYCFLNNNDLFNFNLILGNIKNTAGKTLYFQLHNETFIEKDCFAETGYKMILFFNEPLFMKGSSRRDSVYKNCDYKNCIISHNKSNLLIADAVIFYVGIRKERMGTHPPLNTSNRNSNQVWIFTSVEPPEHYYNTDYRLLTWQKTMNWSCLYRLDSDIPNPYGYLIRSMDIDTRDYGSIYNEKTRNALWIVSHCQVASARRQYVLEMIKNGFDVDIFGGCSSDGSKVDVVQLQQIIPLYKFFLAFENSLCIDYITEKYFDNYNFSWILIVRGGANYNKLLPMDTFVNTAHFKNVSALVHYLTDLGNDRFKYVNFLKNKNKYFSIRWPGNKLCEICRRLNNLTQFRKSYDDLDTYLHKDQCLRPNDLH